MAVRMRVSSLSSRLESHDEDGSDSIGRIMAEQRIRQFSAMPLISRCVRVGD